MRPALLAAAAAAAAAGWLFYLWELSLTVPAGLDLYDFANNLLYAWDMLRGNWLLHGWVVTQDPHWLTDDMVYVLGLWAHGFDPTLLHAEPVTMYAAFVALAAWASVSSLGLGLRARAIIMGIAVLPLALPSATLSAQVLVGPYHTGTAAVALGAILALAPRPGPLSGARRTALAALGGVLLAAGRIGDPYMLTLGILPIIAVAAYSAAVRPRPFRAAWAALPLAAAAAAWAVAAAVLVLLPRLGGFAMRASLPPTIPLSDLGPRVLSFIGTFLDLSGGNIFGQVMGGDFVYALVRLAYLCAAAWAAAAVLADLRRGRHRDWIIAVLAAAVLISAASTFLYGPGDYLGDEHRAPVFLLMGVVLARRLALSHRDWLAGTVGRRAAAAGLCCAAIAFLPLPIYQLQHPRGFDDPARFRQVALARWLAGHGFRRGYGSYDTASIVTVQTRRRVTVRPLISTNQYAPLPRRAWRLIPNIELMANNAWYAGDTPRTFLIVDNGDVDAQTARQTFGPPDHVYRVAGFEIFTWDRGILCTLPPLGPRVAAEERGGVPPPGAACRRVE